MSGLKIGRGVELPIDVAGEAIAILAKRGAGKTNTGRVLVEELDAAHVQTIVLDPVGAWWGLRASADGKHEGLSLPVLGGAHGDVPLQSTAGALLADVVVDTGQSLVLDLSDFSKTEQRRFVTDFAERLYTRKAREKTLLHLVLEEADEFAPQRVNAGDARMVGAIEQLVRRGRGRGIGLTMITQRSASLNKSVLEQTDVLLMMRTTGPRDRNAIEAWVAKQDVEGADDVLPSLSQLETGEAWIWNPERGLLQRVRIRLARTFDSSSTPKAGERRRNVSLAPIDLTRLGAEISATAERAKENDPRELRKQLQAERRHRQELEQTLEGLQREVRTATELEPVRVEVPVPLLEPELVKRLEHALADAKELGDRIKAAGAGLRDLADENRIALTRAIESLKEGTWKTSASPSAPSRLSSRTGSGGSASGSQRSRSASPAAAPAAAAPSPVVGIRSASGASNTPRAEGVSAPQQRILDALAALEAIGLGDAHKTQLALFAQASPKSSSYSNNLGHLNNQLGLIHYPAPGRVALTDAGRAIADGSHAPTSTNELHAFVYDLVGGAKARLLEQLVAVYPAALNKQQLADAAGASPTSSSFSNNLGALRSLGLIGYPQPGLIVALPVLFLEEAA